MWPSLRVAQELGCLTVTGLQTQLLSYMSYFTAPLLCAECKEAQIATNQCSFISRGAMQWLVLMDAEVKRAQRITRQTCFFF